MNHLYRKLVTMTAVIWCSLIVFPPTADATDGDFDAVGVFTNRCGACHTVGKGDAIGPDLSGVSERRERSWLISFIRSSQTVIQGGDPVAGELFARFDQTKMPDHPYAVDEIAALLDLIDSGGPQREATIRLASDASAEDIDAGRVFFASSNSNGLACTSCHTVGRGSLVDRTYLGGSLRQSFSRFFDRELHAILKRSDPTCRRALSPDESFLVRAYLRHVEMKDGDPVAPAEAFPLLAGSAGLLLLAVARRRKRGIKVETE